MMNLWFLKKNQKSDYGKIIIAREKKVKILFHEDKVSSGNWQDSEERKQILA